MSTKLKQQKRKPPNYWTLENCQIEAHKFPSLVAWQKNSKGSYKRAWIQGWIAKCSKHMVTPDLKKKWTDEALLADARKYRSKSAWEKASASAYNLSRQRGLHEINCAHMEPIRRLGFYKTPEEVLKAAKKCKTRSEFHKNCTLSRAAKQFGIVEQVIGHLPYICSATMRAKKWTKKMFMESAAGHDNVSSWKQADPQAVNAARKPKYRKWYTEITQHMNGLRERWTEKKILANARKFKSAPRWHQESPNAWDAARARGKDFVSLCEAHMTKTPLPFGESVILEFLLQHDIGYVHQFYLDEAPINRMPYDFFIPKLDLFIEYQGRQHERGWRSCAKSQEKIARNDALKKAHILERKSQFCAIFAQKKELILEQLQNALKGLRYRKTPRALTSKEQQLVNVRIVWSKDAVLKEARKYKTRTAFQEGSAGAHGAAKREGWYKDACAHMQELRHRWSDEEIIAVGSQYASNQELREKNYACYSVALQRGLLSKLNLRLQYKPANTITPEWIKKTMEGFVYLKDWRKAFPSEDSALTKLGLYQELTKDLKRIKTPNGTWNKAKCKEVAKLCKTRREFDKKYKSASHACTSHGWRQEVLAHIPSQAPERWNWERLCESRQDHESFARWCKVMSGAQDALYGRYRHKLDEFKLFWGEPKQHKPYTDQEIIDCAKQYPTKRLWQKDHAGMVQTARSRGKAFYDMVTKHMVCGKRYVRENFGKWTNQNIANEALNYSTRGEFKKKSASAYAQARHRGILDEVCAHMRQLRQPNRYWNSRSNILKAAKGCATRTEFKNRYSRAAVVARKMRLSLIWIDGKLQYDGLLK